MTLCEGTPLGSAAIVCGWLAANYGLDLDASHTLLFLEMDEFLSLPDEVQAHGQHRHQSSPTAPVRIGVAAGILAKHAVGARIPEAEIDE
jgi:hypothetical protein